jgi:hypothetical protein
VKTIFLATEDVLSEEIGRKIIELTWGLDMQIQALGNEGSGYLKKNMKKFCEIARHYPVFVLTDLDDMKCAPRLVESWLPDERSVSDQMVLRVAVREIEAWLLADRESLAQFFGISAAKIPPQVEHLDDPKAALLQLGKLAKREIRDDLLPKRGALAKQGIGYNSALTRFIREFWILQRASENSDSLRRAADRMTFVKQQRNIV